MPRDSFQENSVIITGASSGIGRCLALGLAAQGAWLTLAARSAERLEQVAQECREQGARAIALPTDISIEEECRTLIEAAAAEYTRIDTLVCNAGRGMRAWFEELPDLTVMRTLMEANYWGTVYCTHYALPHLRRSRGRIVGVISGGGLFVAPGSCGYGASKHALAGFLDTLRFELEGTGVTVTTIYPEWVATGISTRVCRPDGSSTSELSPLERGAMPLEQCAAIILRAMAKRQREAMSARIRLGLLLRAVSPGFVDRIAGRSFAGDECRPPRP